MGQQPYQSLLEGAERNILEASRLKADWEDRSLEISRECDSMKEAARKRQLIIEEQREQENKVANLAEMLAPYKRERANIQTAAEQWRKGAEEKRKEAEQKREEARILEEEARILGEEARILEQANE